MLPRLLLIPLLSVGLFSAILGQSLRHADERIDGALRQGIDLTLRQEYDSARSVFRGLSRAYPENPAGYLYEAAVLQTMAMDYEERVPETEFDSLIALAKAKAEEAIEKDPDSPWPYYFLGTALGNEAVARAEGGDWFGAATRGMSSASNFEKALACDSSITDAFAGIGTYYYWKSRKIAFLTWLPFISDRRSEGRRLLEECAKSGRYNRFAAMSSLVAMCIDAGEFDEASRYARESLASYPDNRIFLWGLATSLERSGKRDEAIRAYSRLLAAMASDARPNRYNELVCRLNLLSLKLESGSWEGEVDELEILHELVRGPFPEHLERRVQEKLRRIKSLELTMEGTP